MSKSTKIWPSERCVFWHLTSNRLRFMVECRKSSFRGLFADFDVQNDVVSTSPEKFLTVYQTSTQTPRSKRSQTGAQDIRVIPTGCAIDRQGWILLGRVVTVFID